MTENIREQISALLDDELSQHEMKQVLGQLSEQEQLRSTWERYNLVSDVIRGEAETHAAPDFADRIREQIDAEPAILAAPKPVKQTPAWVKPLAGTAVAASVAVFAVMTAPQILSPEKATSPQVATTEVMQPNHVQLASMPSTQNYHLANSVQYRVRPVVVARPTVKWSTQYSGARWKNLAKPGTENRLNKYLVDHSEYAAQGPVRGAVPYATFVGYDARQ